MPDLFEGPEKKLEITLCRPDPALRDNRDGRWADVVAASGAAIISHMATDRMDAYLLSESSLFVWENRVLMITCGQTILIDAVPAILARVDPANVARVFYERRSLMHPCAPSQAADFDSEVQRLAQWFPGRSYCIGPADHDHVRVFFSAPAPVMTQPDTTVQMLMTELAPERSAAFDARYAGRRAPDAALAGLDRLLPTMQTDAHLFSPCGYSLNGIRRDTYCTLHVTPQPESSYASFETNLRRGDYQDLVTELIDVFCPGRLCLVMTTGMDRRCSPLHETIGPPSDDYAVTEKGIYAFDGGYTMSFLNLMRAADGGVAG